MQGTDTPLHSPKSPRGQGNNVQQQNSNEMTKQQINERLNGGLHCPICGMRLMDLAHDGYECGDADYHDYFCTECGLDITINTDSCKEEQENTTRLVSRIGEVESELRDLLRELELSMGFSDTLEYDGETLTKDRVGKWQEMLEDMDKYCFYV